MSSLSSIVSARGSIRISDPDGQDVRLLQIALQQAGYRVADDGVFGPNTDRCVRQFQRQHYLKEDGIVGPMTAALLDVHHAALVEKAVPELDSATGSTWPHDDTASLKAFYGDPSADLAHWKLRNLGSVKCPWELFYEGKPWPHEITIHKKVAQSLGAALDQIWQLAGKDNSSPLLRHVKNFSGSGNFRPVRGSSRLSCHAFWAAIDFDAEALPMGHGVPATEMPQGVVDAFIAAGAFWGGDFTGRKDPMHFQWAHEG